ncbi:unnamed protein product [Polarella glacialis]|uniref:protein-tyrosine-phosphatase n=1 Tax=Polarella glacialis TaxID=89957 RepID=A0A813DQL2_POLGL|nr:unnamed protein product [Polarella glacialis]
MEDGAVSEDVIVAVVCTFAGGDVKCLSLPGISPGLSLAEFKLLCSSQLGVPSVLCLDYNEDMNSMSLLQLGIGLSGLPFAVEAPSDAEVSGAAASSARTPAATDLATAATAISTAIAKVTAATATTATATATATTTTATPASAANAGLSSSARPMAERQALKDASEIQQGFLYLSGQMAAGSLPVLKELGVSHVLNCCDRVPCKFKKSLSYKVISVFDTKGSDIRAHFAEALEFIDAAKAAGGAVLVHCMVGASRSTSIVLAWLVSRCKIPLQAAFRDVRIRRSVARPNRAFCEQLMEFEREVLGSTSATLADFGHS